MTPDERGQRPTSTEIDDAHGDALLDDMYRDWPGESGDYDFGGPDDPAGVFP